VDLAQVDRFLERVHRLDEMFHGEIDFRVIGPLPPYSFYMAHVTRLAGDQLGRARQVLHLSGSVSAAEVRAAYRRLAAEAQRRPGGEEHFGAIQAQRLKNASDLLLAYLQQYKADPRQQARYEPRQGTTSPLFLLAVKRSGGKDAADAALPSLAGGRSHG
jgi:hypothetical protein